jgi:predicted TIM-barrel fold metal-dependent hydrolase
MPIEHPSGETTIIARLDDTGAVTSAAILRTARKADGRSGLCRLTRSSDRRQRTPCARTTKWEGWIPTTCHSTRRPSARFQGCLQGAVDAHCHVFGPGDQFPFASERGNTRPAMRRQGQLFALRDHLGLSRNVIVQATCHGRTTARWSMRWNGLAGTLRGASPRWPDISRRRVAEMDAAGVRGVRFNFVKRLVDATPKRCSVEVAERIQGRDRLARSWSISRRRIYRRSGADFLRQMPGTVVVDHMGRPDVTKGADTPISPVSSRLMDRQRRISGAR